MAPPAHTNRLIHETSPYLLQHAHNPVDWFPWGAEAFATARRENKPIFLSIGYSTCHWCHVMERESFENPDVAAVLNAHFVCIKVDREERPDLDKIYMTATQMTTGSGGWPMSVWLTGDLKPFYCGTYFPPESRYGRPGFRDLLLRIREVWDGNPAGIREQADRLTAALAQVTTVTGAGGELDRAPLELGLEQFRGSYDAVNGGFGGAPKFPRPVALRFLMRTAGRDMALHTLRQMGQGGLFDHLGGGFHRYSVDDHWLVSHFEKMLYDQGQLVSSYVDAYQWTGDEFFADIARRTCDYVLRDLTSPTGGFYAAEDADSEGVEGKFYVWTRAEIERVLGDRAAEFCRAYHVTEAGNWEQGNNVLHGTGWPAERERLLAARAQRIRPHRDEKIITAWNGWMISGLCRLHQTVGDDRYLAAAQRAARDVYRDGHLVRSGTVPAVLDDYACLMNALVDLYETDFDAGWLGMARTLAERMVARFSDEAHGGFFLNDGADASVILRTKEEYDGAEPSGNSVATRGLWRLGEYRAVAERTLRLFAGRLRSAPQAMPEMLCALDDWLGPRVEITLGAPAPEFLREIRRRYLPRAVVRVVPGHPPALVCVDQACRLPTSHPVELGRQLDELRGR
jgi:hypothetical protein